MRILYLEVHNFLSFGPHIAVDFNQSSPTLVKGTTKTGEDSNGSGKSSLFEAIYWCLTGKTIRKIQSKHIVRFGQKEAYVTVILQIGDSTIKVYRYWSDTSKKMVITHNGQQTKYHSAKDGTQNLFELLNTDEATLGLTCFYGRRYLTFSSMTPGDRAKLLSRLANTTDWEKGEELARREHTALDKQLTQNLTASELKKEDLDGLIRDNKRHQADLKAHEDSTAAELQEIAQEIESRKCDIEDLESSIEQEESRIEELQAALDDSIYTSQIEEAEQKIEELQQKIQNNLNVIGELSTNNRRVSRNIDKEKDTRRQANKDIEGFEKSIDRYKSLLNGVCPTCKQSAVKLDQKNEWNAEINALKSDIEQGRQLIKDSEATECDMKKELGVYEEDTQALQQENSKHKQEQEAIKTHIQSLRDLDKESQSAVNKAYQTITKLQQDKQECLEDMQLLEQGRQDIHRIAESLQDKIKDNDARISKVNGELAKLKQAEGIIRKDMYVADYWRHGFKSIRYGVFTSLCDFLESLLNEFLQQQDLDFEQVKIATTKETADGKERACLDIVITRNGRIVPLGALSEGETQRVDIACYIALSELINKTSGFQPELLVMDEPLTGIDMAGKKKIFDLINALSAHRQIFVIDHNADFSDMFTGTIEVTKQQYSEVSVNA